MQISQRNTFWSLGFTFMLAAGGAVPLIYACGSGSAPECIGPDCDNIKIDDQEDIQEPLTRLALQSLTQYGRFDAALFAVAPDSGQVSFAPGAALRPASSREFADGLDLVNGDEAARAAFVSNLRAVEDVCGGACVTEAYDFVVEREPASQLHGDLYRVGVAGGRVPTPEQLTTQLLALFNHAVPESPLLKTIDLPNQEEATGGSSGVGQLTSALRTTTIVANVFAGGMDCASGVNTCDTCVRPNGQYGGYRPIFGRHCCGSTCE